MNLESRVHNFSVMRMGFCKPFFLTCILVLASCAQAPTQTNGVRIYKAPSAAKVPEWGPKFNEISKKGFFIADQRSDKEAVILIWASAGLGLEGATHHATKEVIEENLILIAFRMVITEDGTLNYTYRSAPTLRTLSDIAIPPIDRSRLSPLAAGIVALVSQSFRQLLKPDTGQPFIHVFAGQSVDACQPGGFWVQYEGFDYSFKTPLEACQDIKKPDLQAQFSAGYHLLN